MIGVRINEVKKYQCCQPVQAMCLCMHEEHACSYLVDRVSKLVWLYISAHLHSFHNFDFIIVVKIVVSPGVFRGGLATPPGWFDWAGRFVGSSVSLS